MYWKDVEGHRPAKKSRGKRRARKSARRPTRRARVSSQVGPRQADRSFYAKKPRGARKSRRGGLKLGQLKTSKTGVVYRRTPSGWERVGSR